MKSRAALYGWSLSRYVEQCLEKEARFGKARSGEVESVGDWIDSLPKTPKSAYKEVEEVLSEAGFEEMLC